MAQSHYDREMEKLASTYDSAIRSNIGELKRAISSASDASVIGVGSGGSYTVASVLCRLHEKYTGRVSRASTPLEVISNPTLAVASPVFMISAEGKNPDIAEALVRARRHSARNLQVMTNRQSSPLMECVKGLSDVTSHVFELEEKDGFLATNSLLLDAVLIARAYSELDGDLSMFPTQFGKLQIGQQSIANWIAQAEQFTASTVERGSLIVIYSPLLKPIAEDLESRLSESALLYSQVTDLRSFAHGRHLWLSERRDDCAVLALTEPSLGTLWEDMKTLFPSDVPTAEMALQGSSSLDLISGLIAEMFLISRVANRVGKDPGRPSVPKFGRDLYYLDIREAIPAPDDSSIVELSKYEVFGARWPSSRNIGLVRRVQDDVYAAFEKQRFRALVFDYDGTLTSSQRGESAPSKNIVEHLKTLVDAGVIVGIASGRGGSVQECLRDCLPPAALEKIHLGLYNGGWIADASTPPQPQEKTVEFLSHVTRIVRRLKMLGVPIDVIKPTHPYQVSVRFREGIATEHMWYVLADALRLAGLSLSSMVRSKHSIDILAAGIIKSRLIAYIVQKFGIDPYKVLTMGDQGAWPGNDSSLLEHRFSLSVDEPSRRIDRGWKLAPTYKRDVDATLWYLDRVRYGNDGEFMLPLVSDIK